jgi:autotransporter-associated beta strand protein
LNNSSSSYTIAAPTGGTLSLTGRDTSGVDAGSAVVELVSGSHSISAPVALVATTNLSMFDPAARLAISGAISGSGALNISGSGTLVLSANNNSFTGAVDVSNSAILVLGNPGSLPDGASITLGDPSLFSSPAPIALAAPPASEVSPVPEPSALMSLAAAVAGVGLLLGVRRRTAIPFRCKRPFNRNERTP